MTRRRPPPTIGMVKCGHCSDPAAVRQGSGGEYYYVCMCSAQPIRAHEYVLEHATLWLDKPPPDEAPEWIRQGLTFKPGARAGGDRPRKPAPAGQNNDAPRASEASPGADAPPAPARSDAPATAAKPVSPPRGEPEPDERIVGGLFI